MYDVVIIEDRHIVYVVPYLDGFLVDMVDDGLDEEIDRMASDFAMRMKEVTHGLHWTG